MLTYEPGEQYDAIFLREMLYYFSADQAAELLRRMAGFLQPGGKIYVQVWPGARSLFTTPGEFLEAMRNCGLAIVAERTMNPSEVGRGAYFLVLGLK